MIQGSDGDDAGKPCLPYEKLPSGETLYRAVRFKLPPEVQVPAHQYECKKIYQF